jgi:feruloyl esterase
MLALNWFLAGPLSTSFRSVTSQSDSFRDKCLKFQPNIQNAKLEFTEFLQHGTQTFLTYRDLSCGGPGLSPVLSQDVCRVALYITTSDRSGIHFEAWLPKDWSGRFLSTGNGGIGGCKKKLCI